MIQIVKSPTILFVNELHESSTLLGDGPGLRDRLTTDGYLYFAGLLPREAVAAVRADVLGVLDRSGWLVAGSDVADGVPGVEWINEGDDLFFPMYRELQSLYSFHALAHHDALVAAIGRLLGDEVLVHPRKISRVTFPDNPFGTTPPHQDYRFIQGTPDVITAWVPLGDLTAGEGGLRVLAGSQHQGLRPPVSYDAVGGIGVAADDTLPGWATTTFEMGDVLLFHSLTVHGAVPNRSHHLRISADYRYQAVRHPVTEGTLHPHYHPSIPDWPALTGGWASTDVIEAPSGTRVVAAGSPLDELPLDPSPFAQYA